MKIELSSQVVEFIRKQPPEPRRKLRQALRLLALEKGDIKPLEGPLENYYRLRIGVYRLVFVYSLHAGKRSVRCLFIERRNVIYEIFTEILKQL